MARRWIFSDNLSVAYRRATLIQARCPAQQLSGITIKDNTELPKLANWFHEQGVQRVFLSLGSEGVFYSDLNEQAFVPAIPVSMINANGSGTVTHSDHQP